MIGEANCNNCIHKECDKKEKYNSVGKVCVEWELQDIEECCDMANYSGCENTEYRRQWQTDEFSPENIVRNRKQKENEKLIELENEIKKIKEMIRYHYINGNWWWI